MTPQPTTDQTLRAENAELRARLEEAEEMLRAIRAGEVDALVVEGDAGPRLFTLQGLDAAQNRFRGEMLAQVSDAVIAVDTEERVTFLNAAAERGEWRGELIHRTPDGRELHVETSATTLRDPDGACTGYVLAIHDIRERKQAEAVLAQALAKAVEGDRLLGALMEHVPEGITIADAPDVTIRMVSRAGRELTGKPREVIEGIPVGEHTAKWDIYCVDGVTIARNEDLPLTRAVQQGEVVIGEEWVLGHPDGRRIPILCNAAPIRDTSDKVVSGVIAWRDITQHKQAEAALRLTNERFDLAVKCSQVVLFQQDLELRYTWLQNPVPGFKGPDAIGKRDADLMERAADAALTEALKREVIRSGVSQRQEVLVQIAGSARHYDLLVEPLRDAAGLISGVTCAAIDITARKQAEEAIARLAAIVESSHDALFGEDLDGTITSWNRGAEQIFGFSADEIVGTSIMRLIPADRQAAEHELQHKLAAGERGGTLEAIQQTKDGREFHASITISPLKDAAGKVIGTARVVRDITERKHAEAALRESEQQYSALANASSDVAYRMSADWSLMLPLDGRDLVPSSDQPLGDWAWLDRNVPRDEHARVRQAISEAIARKTLFELEHRVRRPDGSIGWTFSRAAPIFDENEGVIAWFGAASDITTRKAAEEALHASEERLRRFAGQLEHLVNERTEELVQSQDRLRLLATELNLAEQRERKRLAGELHDYLAQLLVLGCLKLGQVRRAGLPSKAEETVKETEEVLTQALNYSRTLMAQLSPPILQEHGLPAGLTWLGEQMQRQGLRVRVTIGDMSSVSLTNDCEILLFQSVRELLMNALKHADSTQVVVQLQQSESRLCIEVRDDGVGFDLAAAAAAAGSSTTAMSSKFGLFSIRERMVALGGWFDVQSAPGEGTTASLVLPVDSTREPSSELKVLSAELSDQVRNSEPRTQDSTPHQQHAKTRVLLVDDHAMVRQGLRSVLDSYADIEVVGEAWDGEDAIAAVERLRPAVVVMDINMPKMNGIKATSQITSRFPGSIVIGLSVQAGSENEVAMKNAGASMLLTKEAAVEELYKAIRQSLDLKLKGKVLLAES